MWLAAALLIITTAASAGEVSDRDRFRLWNECRPMGLVVEGLPDDATDISLTEDAIEVAVRSRLRAARLYRTHVGVPFLQVDVGVARLSYRIQVDYVKWVRDHASGEDRGGTTWSSGSYGTHGRDSGFILSSLSQVINRFIDEYLGVNADACK